VVIIFFLQPWLLKKSNWIIWGGDLYWYRYRKKEFKYSLYEVIRRSIPVINKNEL
jgi:dTDP-N-acetylfucosamine:lipid II N-acetylfucosaminyltransferase